jgi:hypothetical protein
LQKTVLAFMTPVAEALKKEHLSDKKKIIGKMN